MITIVPKDETHVQVMADASIRQELFEHFAYKSENYKFHPLYKKHLWDGNIHLYNKHSFEMYKGLVPRVHAFAHARSYTVTDQAAEGTENFSKIEAEAFTDALGLPFPLRDYQLESFIHGVRHRRSLIISPTASGKSLIAYCLTRYYLNNAKEKVLIIVPTTNLVEQLYTDYQGYNYDVIGNVQKISGNYKYKVPHKDVVITTWQSIYRNKEAWFKRFGCIIIDEAHQAKATSLVNIMKKCQHIKYRFGLTGSLSKVELNNITIEGLFGNVHQVITTKELIDNKTLSDFEIKAILLSYNEESKKKMRNTVYHDEIKFIVGHNRRNAFIANLALSLEKNTLVLYNYVDTHGKIIYDLICQMNKKGKKVFFISGNTPVEEREKIRAYTETNEEVIIVASFGVFSTGVNIVNLFNLVFFKFHLV